MIDIDRINTDAGRDGFIGDLANEIAERSCEMVDKEIESAIEKRPRPTVTDTERKLDIIDAVTRGVIQSLDVWRYAEKAEAMSGEPVVKIDPKNGGRIIVNYWPIVEAELDERKLFDEWRKVARLKIVDEAIAELKAIQSDVERVDYAITKSKLRHTEARMNNVVRRAATYVL